VNFWTSETLRSACAGTWLARPPALVPLNLAGLTIDSRGVQPGQVFLAIKGERFDGHEFVWQAVERGAAMVIVDQTDSFKPDGLPKPALVLKVPDTRRALLRLAAAYRQSLSATRVIAVCGSNGKTTTTRLIQALLSVKFRGTASAKSFNNDIGVPLTILAAKPADQYLLCEVGSNSPGEIATLAEVVRPDVAVITSIGREHLERLGSLEGVAKEESAIFGGLRPGGAAVITGETKLLDEHARGLPAAIRFGHGAHCDLRLTGFEHIEMPPASTDADAGLANAMRIEVNGRRSFDVPLVGEHNALNALAAIGVARRFGLSDDEIAAGFAKATAPGMRLEPSIAGGVRVINDAYNANPDSTLAALRTFAALCSGADRRVVVLGDMLELGEWAEDAHREIGAEIRGMGSIDLLIAVGPLAALAGAMVEADDGKPVRVVRLPDVDGDRAAQAAAHLRPGDAVLLKGSRRMGLERVAAALAQGPSPAVHVEPRPGKASLGGTR